LLIKYNRKSLRPSGSNFKLPAAANSITVEIDRLIHRKLNNSAQRAGNLNPVFLCNSHSCKDFS
jgi:hypothetical protein